MPEVIAVVDFVGEISIRDADRSINGLARAVDRNEEWLAGEERESGVGVRDIAWAGNLEAANPEEVSNGSQVEKTGGGGAAEDVGLTWVGSLIGGAGVAVGVGGLSGRVMEEEDEEGEEYRGGKGMADWGWFHFCCRLFWLICNVYL